LSCVDVLGAGDRRCRLTVLDQRAWALDGGRTEAGESDSNPTGENDRRAQRR
jgi:hypothetical protein